MNFQELARVENADKYIDILLGAGRKAKSAGAQGKSKLLRIKQGEYSRFSGINKSAQKQLFLILKGFPSIDTLPEFYQQLIQHTIDRRYLKHCLAGVKWSMDKISQFERVYRDKIRKVEDIEHIKRIKSEGIGRICSTIKAIKKELIFLEESRKTMKAFPAVKTKLFSVAIAGFPNVGKSTLLSKVSSANPKIAAYAFTTQSINIGYSTIKRHKIQYLDTPGTLNRLDKMNDIEKYAYLVLRYVADIIIYVVDLTEGYDMDDQLKLLKKMYTYDKPVIVYLSKLDILNDNEKLEAFQKKYKKETIVTTVEEIEDIVKKQMF